MFFTFGLACMQDGGEFKGLWQAFKFGSLAEMIAAYDEGAQRAYDAQRHAPKRAASHGAAVRMYGMYNY
jgi:hypothetical protein